MASGRCPRRPRWTRARLFARSALSTTVQSVEATGFPDLPGVIAHALAIEVRLETMPHRFVQQDPRVSRREHHFHLAGRSLARIEHGHGDPHRLARRALRGSSGFEKYFETHATATARVLTACRRPPASAITRTPVRSIGCTSRTNFPSLVAIRTSRRLSTSEVSTRVTRASAARAARSARSNSSRLASPLAATDGDSTRYLCGAFAR